MFYILNLLLVCSIILAAHIASSDRDLIIHHNSSSYNYSFEEFTTNVNSQFSRILDESSVNILLRRLNLKCLTAETLFQSIGVDPSQGLNEEQFKNVSLIIAYYLKFGKTNASCYESETLIAPSEARNSLFGSESICQQDITVLYQTIKNNVKYNNTSSQNCIESSSIIPQCTNNTEEISQSVMKMIIILQRGSCLLPGILYFQKELEKYLSTEDGSFNEAAFFELLHQLRIGNILSKKNNDNDDDDNKRDHDHESETDNDHNRTEKNDDRKESKCFTEEELVSIAKSQHNTDANMELTSKDVISICPVLLQQAVSGACVKTEDTPQTNTPSLSNSEYTTAMKYGYGTASVAIISLLALGGLLLFPSIGSASYKLTMQFFIALGVGTLSGDALLHLIPEVVGLHTHEKKNNLDQDEGNSHDHEKDANEKLYVYLLLVVIAGIYMFYLFENVLHLFNQLNKSNVSFHQHDDQDDEHDHPHEVERKVSNTHRISSVIAIALDENMLTNAKKNSKVEYSVDLVKQLEADNSKRDVVCCGVTSIGIMVFIGDILHNFGDGLALGVAFSSSWIAGVGASIAIFCHELPHEFGDFAIYLKNGMNKWEAVGCNFIAACFSFIGLYIGLSVAENPEARQWMLAVIAGMFLYIALVDVLHEMTEEKSENHPWLLFFIQNIGMCLGCCPKFIQYHSEAYLQNVKELAVRNINAKRFDLLSGEICTYHP